MNPRNRILFCLVVVVLSGIVLRFFYMQKLVGDPHFPDFGGDPCHHYSIAKNITEGNGPRTSFIFSYWFSHPDVPAVTDVYSPGPHFIMAFFIKFISNDFFGARLASFVAGVISLALIFFIGLEVSGILAGFIASLFLAFNWTHIEHSAVVMTPVITSFFILLSVYIVLLSFRKKGYPWKVGVSLGLVQLCQSVGILLMGAYCFSVYLREGRLFLRNQRWIWPILFFMIIVMPWGIYTKVYFGKWFYSNLSFYPIVENWGRMLFETTPPQITSYKHLFVQLLSSSMKTVRLLMNEFPGQINVLFLIERSSSWMLIPGLLGIILSCFRVDRLFLVLCFFGMLFANILGARALGGLLFPRHLLPCICLFYIFSGIFFSDLYKFFSSIKIKNKIKENIKTVPEVVRNFLKFAIVISIGFTVVQNIKYSKNILRANVPTFWMRESKSQIEGAAWIKNYTDKDSRFLYAMTPQDLSCLTDRNVVIDPYLSGGTIKQSIDAIQKYRISYMVLDYTKEVYDRSGLPSIEIIKKVYEDLHFEELYHTSTRDYYVFKISSRNK